MPVFHLDYVRREITSGAQTFAVTAPDLDTARAILSDLIEQSDEKLWKVHYPRDAAVTAPEVEGAVYPFEPEDDVTTETGIAVMSSDGRRTLIPHDEAAQYLASLGEAAKAFLSSANGAGERDVFALVHTLDTLQRDRARMLDAAASAPQEA
ncbi:hypothetical protein [Gluconobacter sp. Dm-44]|uniref:hypothetical protein n=1 Tax=Gluconobacter sp. Dm-44 TaxID=2799805 RepID=UPI001B8B5DA2|nr:hypothetical protein [Gluconobacter sp. Dm-44]